MNNSTKNTRANILANYITEGYNKRDIKINSQGQAYIEHKEGQIMLSLRSTYDSFHNGQTRQYKRIF